MSVWPCVVAYLIGRPGWPLLYASAVAIAAARAGGLKGAAFQAAAHLFVGGLVGAAIADRTRRRWALVALAVALSVVETACFFLIR